MIKMRLSRGIAAAILCAMCAHGDTPHFGTGIKIGEVDTTSAIVWVRLTRDANPVALGAPLPEVVYRGPDGKEHKGEDGRRDPSWTPIVTFPGMGETNETTAVAKLEGAVPGMAGEARIRFRAAGTENWRETAWMPVDPTRDFTRQFTLDGLAPGTRHELVAEARGGATMTGTFQTAPAPDAEVPVRFVVTTCHDYPRRDLPEGFKIYAEIAKLNPAFFVHAGDILYYDRLAKSEALARWHWQRMYALPTNIAFHKGIASYFMKDDHDTWVNDCWPSMNSQYMGTLTFAQGQAIFLEQVPMRERTYRTIRWGRDLQIWMVEGRDFRSPNDAPDGPTKTIWGDEQKAWFKQTVAASDATFRILISPTPLVGPDRDSKKDNHANKGFAHEGRELREFMAAQRNMAVICGDRHWQYVSRDNATGLREYACGPGTDQHAGGYSLDRRRPEHHYLNITGGFLCVEIVREDGTPVLRARHHGVDGALLHEDAWKPE